MNLMYSKRNWLKDSNLSTSAIFTEIDSYSLGVTSIPENPKGEPLVEHVASINLIRSGETFGMSFKIIDTDSKEEAMKAISTMIEDLSQLRNEIIKL